MAYTEAQKTALEKALASGVRRVTYDGHTVEYNSLDEIRTALAEVNRALQSAAGTVMARQYRIYTSKGL